MINQRSSTIANDQQGSSKQDGPKQSSRVNEEPWASHANMAIKFAQHLLSIASAMIR
jgi:hypothetical protein